MRAALFLLLSSLGLAVPDGAHLYSELGCANCHGGETVAIQRVGPNLLDLSKRVSRDWVAAFLADPSHGGGQAAMPHMMADQPEAIPDVLAWLGSLNGNLRLRAARHVSSENGEKLLNEIGCMTCHADRPIPDMTAKTSLVALTEFFQRTAHYRPDGRMPQFPMTAQEAGDLAGHLLGFEGSDPRAAPNLPAWPKADAAAIARGKAFVTERNCAACHQLPGVAAKPLNPIAASVPPDAGCIATTPVAGQPHYPLSADQRAALQTYLKSERRVDPQLGFTAMNCTACHALDGAVGPTPVTERFFHGDESLGDSGRFPPPLTGIGAKLQRRWLEGVFQGEGRVRPYLKTRMPVYPKHAAILSDWLEGVAAKPETPLAVVEDLEAGYQLLGTHGGMNCTTCHRWGDRASLGIQGPDIRHMDRRLQPEWFRAYLLDPAAYRQGTLMPALWPEGQSAIKGILGGNAEKQIGAIWAASRDGEGLPSGMPEQAVARFELIPTDRPIVQRTFLKGVGTKAILVGFPAGIHLAMDGETGAPAFIWRGRFFDAYNTWFSRFAPFESPLEEAIAFDVPPAGLRFRGYELDKAGNPTFLLEKGTLKQRETYTAKGNVLHRHIAWTGAAAPVVAHPKGLGYESQGGRTIRISYILP